MNIAVIGNSLINTGFAVAADLSLAGHDVRVGAWSGTEDSLEPIRRKGGVTLEGRIDRSSSRQRGLAKPRIYDQLHQAVAGAEIVVLDVLPTEFEQRFSELLPHLGSGQIVHFNMHGYWPALRLAPMLKQAGRGDITLSEGPAPTLAADYKDGVATLQWVRRQVPVATFPATRSPSVFQKLRSAFPELVPATNVLETGFASLNMMIHFPLVLLNIGWCDRAESASEGVHLYGPGNTRNTGRLAEAQDAERAPVSAAYGVPCRSLKEHLTIYYDAHGESVEEIVRNSIYYRDLPPYPATVWNRWLSTDIAHAHVPFVSLAEAAGFPVPMHRAIVTMTNALLGADYWRTGVTLERMGLAGRTVNDIKGYVTNGAFD